MKAMAFYIAGWFLLLLSLALAGIVVYDGLVIPQDLGGVAPLGGNPLEFKKAVIDTFSGRLWILPVVFSIFLALWLGISTFIFTGYPGTLVRLGAALTLGLIMVAYGSSLAIWLLKPIIDAAPAVAGYFLAIPICALLGTGSYAFGVLLLHVDHEKLSERSQRFDEVLQDLEQRNIMSGPEWSGMLSNSRVLNDNLKEMDSYIRGNLFSVRKAPRSLNQAYGDLQKLLTDVDIARENLWLRIRDELDVLQDPELGLQSRDRLLDHYIPAEHHWVVARYSRDGR